MLKEMDYIQKVGIKHPAKAVVIYSLKRAVPGIFGEGLGSGGTSFLPMLKTAANWECILSNDTNAKAGLRDVLSLYTSNAADDPPRVDPGVLSL